MMASNMGVIMPLLADDLFLLSFVLWTLEDLMECGLDGRGSAGGGSVGNRRDGSGTDERGANGSGSDGSGANGSGSDRS